MKKLEQTLFVKPESQKDTPFTESEQKLLHQHQALKLQIELVPASSFYANVRSIVKTSEWNRIRKKVYEKANSLCEICNGKGTKHPVECHEVWIYDDTKMIQRLDYFQSICPLCHEVKHMGKAKLFGNGDRAFNRFVEINQLDVWTAIKIRSAVFKQWRKRSEQQWTLNISHLIEWGINTDSAQIKTK